MTWFIGENYIIFSGKRGDVILRPDGIFLEMRGDNHLAIEGRPTIDLLSFALHHIM